MKTYYYIDLEKFTLIFFIFIPKSQSNSGFKLIAEKLVNEINNNIIILYTWCTIINVIIYHYMSDLNGNHNVIMNIISKNNYT